MSNEMNFQVISTKKKKSKVEYDMYSDASTWLNPKYISTVLGKAEAENLSIRFGIKKWWHIHNKKTDEVIDYFGLKEVSKGKHPHPIDPNNKELIHNTVPTVKT